MAPRVLLLIAHLAAFLSCNAQDSGVVRISIPVRLDSYYRPSVVTLSCAGGAMPASYSYWRRVPGGGPDQQLQLQVEGESSASDQVTFEVPPSLEGLYYCMNGNSTSVNQLEIVAFPLQNLTLAAIKKYTVDVGASVTLPCAYDTPGILTHRYHVDWYRGMEQVMVDANARRYTVSDVDFSLTIHNATIADASRAYFCELRVENLEASSDFVRVGPTFELEVKSPLVVNEGLDDVVGKPNRIREVRFTCRVSGSPEPSVLWTIQGKAVSDLGKPGKYREQKVGRYETDTAIHVTSQLTVSKVEVGDSGGVQCVAVSGSAVVTSGARLVLLPSEFEVEIQTLQSGSATLRATLPTTIPGVFSLVVRYVEDGDTSSDVELFDVSFSDVQTIEYTIPNEKLPRFTTFRVRVAIKVGRVQGDFSPLSNQITVDSESRTMAVCDSSESNDGADSVAITVSVVILVTALIIVVVVVVVLVVIFCRRDSKMVPSASNVSYTDREEISSYRSPSRISKDESYVVDSTSLDSQQLAEREERRKVIGGMPIVDMSNEDLFQSSTLPRGYRASSVDADVRSSDFATQVPYHS